MNRPLALPLEAFDIHPRVSVTLTDESAYLTRYDERGEPVGTFPVCVEQVGAAFRGQSLTAATGLLPPDVLYWRTEKGRVTVALWLPPTRRVITWDSGRRQHRVTLPPLGFVFSGAGRQYKIFAARARPTSERTMLYHAPLPNIHSDGTVCPGNVKFPIASPATIGEAARLFFESHFNHDLSDNRIEDDAPLLNVLRGLPSRRAFPFGKLIFTRITIGQLMSGERTAELFVDDDDDNEEPDPEFNE